MTVRISPLWGATSGQGQTQKELASLSRSRLYHLVPCEIGTIWRESLTGYINRLGWTYHVAPRALVAQEVVPQLNDEQLPSVSAHFSVFGYQGAMVLNGHGALARAWISILAQLTGRVDLPLLTLPWWIGNLSSRKQLRRVPAWCPACLSEWRESDFPIYQPLLWAFQIVTICPRHKDFLKDRCSQCHKTQAVIAAKRSRPGTCTHCGSWLGTAAQEKPGHPHDSELIAWQKWVISALEELHTMSFSSAVFSWEPFFTSLAACLQEKGAYSKVARMTGIRRELLYRWTEGTYLPILETIFKLCYVFDVTPFQMMTNQTARLRQALESETAVRSPQFQRHNRRVDRERCQAYLLAVLEGRERPQGLRQIAQCLGCNLRQLYYHFPKECALSAPLVQQYRRQRKEERLDRVREQVRQAVISVHSLGKYPSQRQLRPLLPGGLMRLSEAKEAWHAALRELGFEL